MHWCRDEFTAVLFSVAISSQIVSIQADILNLPSPHRLSLFRPRSWTCHLLTDCLYSGRHPEPAISSQTVSIQADLLNPPSPHCLSLFRLTSWTRHLLTDCLYSGWPPEPAISSLTVSIQADILNPPVSRCMLAQPDNPRWKLSTMATHALVLAASRVIPPCCCHSAGETADVLNTYWYAAVNVNDYSDSNPSICCQRYTPSVCMLVCMLATRSAVICLCTRCLRG